MKNESMKFSTILKIGGGVILACVIAFFLRAFSDNLQTYRSMTETEHVCRFLESRNAGWDDALKIVIIFKDDVEEFSCE